MARTRPSGRWWIYFPAAANAHRGATRWILASALVSRAVSPRRPELNPVPDRKRRRSRSQVVSPARLSNSSDRERRRSCVQRLCAPSGASFFHVSRWSSPPRCSHRTNRMTVASASGINLMRRCTIPWSRFQSRNLLIQSYPDAAFPLLLFDDCSMILSPWCSPCCVSVVYLPLRGRNSEAETLWTCGIKLGTPTLQHWRQHQAEFPVQAQTVQTLHAVMQQQH